MDIDSESEEDAIQFDDEIDPKKHDKLIEKVLNLNKNQQLKKSSRTEPTLKISEFNLVKSITGKKGSIELDGLTNILKNRKKNSVSVKVKNINKTLPKPLEKPQSERIRRSVAYEKTRLELDRWEATVSSNRVSTNLKFPLPSQTKLEWKETKEITKRFRTKSKLEEKLEEIDSPKTEIEIKIGNDKFPLTMQEMMDKRKEAAKLRAYQSYQEAKARRRNKIKSKKYHRIERKAKIKAKLKELEELQINNPEEALKKLEEIDKVRAEERFSLRHKSTGKWARNQQTRAKYDKVSREVLAQQLLISKELTEKLKNDNSSDSEVEEIEMENIQEDTTKDKEIEYFMGNYRNFLIENNKTDQEFENKNNNNNLNALKEILSNDTKTIKQNVAINIDPNKFLQVKKTNLKTAIPDLISTMDENSNQKSLIVKAFEDDDIVTDFNKEKKKEIDNTKVKNIDLSLPGWGAWGGTDIVINKRKRRRFMVKMPKKIARKDANKKRLIINEKAQKKIKEHMVSEVPFPFKTVKDFEASIRAPIGSTFVPQTVFKRLVKPEVVTKMGTIIEPMSKEMLLGKKSD